MPLLYSDEYDLSNLLSDVAYRRALNHQREMMLITMIEGLELESNPSEWGQHPRRYTVKEGDTLPKLATELYWRPDRWKEIARINGLQPPYNLSPGQTLKLPE